MSSSFPQRNYYAPSPYPQRASLVAYPAPMRLSQGLAAPNNSSFNNRPPMGQSPQSSQQTSGQASGNSPWPLVAGGAALAGAVYLGYQWLNKPRAVETAETAEAIEQSSEETVAKEATKSETGKLLSTATETVASAEKASEATVEEAVVKETPTIVQDAERKVVQELGNVGQSRLSSFARGAWNTATHKGTLATGALLAGGLILDRFVPTLRPAIMAFGAEVPGMVWKSCEESAKQCTPGFTQRAGTGLANMAAGAGTALGTGYAAFKNYSSGLFSKVWNTCGEKAATECAPGLLQKAGVEQALQTGSSYIPTAEGVQEEGAAALKYVPTFEDAKQFGTESLNYFGFLKAPAQEVLAASNGTALDLTSGVANLTSSTLNPLTSLATNATNFTSPLPSLAGRVANLTSSAAELMCPAPSLAGSAANLTSPAASLAEHASNFTASNLTCPIPWAEQATKTAKSVTSITIPAADNAPSIFSRLLDWFKPTPKLPFEPIQLPQNVSSLSNVTDLVTGTSKLPLEPASVSQNASLLSNVTDLVTGTSKLPLEPASVSQNASLLSNVTDLFKAAKQPPSSIGSAPSPSVNLTNPLLNPRPTSPANSTV